jgi:fructoselysine-6-P-deglycase FrlB-like protein
MEREMKDQILDLPAFASKLEQSTEARDFSPTDMVFTGSGDSYAASLFAHYFSSGLARAVDPNDLTQAPEGCKDRTVFITSVSGRTKANVLLARRIKRIARKRVAITANPTGPLASECDNTIPLPYRREETITPGTLSFTMSLLAVASRIKPLPILRNLEMINKRASEWAQHFKIHSHTNFLFVGSGIGHALAAYGAFKIQEVLGEPAEYEHTEQLGHSKLFSIRKTDNILCLVSGRDRATADMSRILAKNGFNANLLTSDAREPVIAGLEAAFSFQQLALRLAKSRGLKDVAFLTDRKRLALSSRLIY